MAKDSKENKHGQITTTVNGKSTSQIVPLVVKDGRITTDDTEVTVKQ